MTRLYLAAGVAAMALAAPAAAAPGGHAVSMQQQRAERPQKAQRAARTERVQAVQTQRADRSAQRAERAATLQTQRAERAAARPAQTERVQQARIQRTERVQAAQAQRAERAQAAQTQRAERMQQIQAQRAERAQQVQTMRAERVQQVQANRALRVENAQGNRGVGYGVGGCPPGLAGKNCTPPGIAAQQGLTTLRANRVAAAQSPLAQRSALALQRLDNNLALAPVPLALTAAGTPVLPVGQAVQYVGQPLSALSTLGLSPVPSALSYLYPTTPQYYYQYGNGYMYQVDRTSNLISALLPLLAGGFMPGQYLPSSYMSSYVPDYYGFNSFYPASYGSGYSPYGYDNLCNRYANGVVYQVDCYTGLVQNVIPLYASGYGVGQMLPSSYDYYNLPYQYRGLYPASANTGYWYAPGAIYQYDPTSSLITSVAALLSPGLTVGQTLPMGYNTYNVPYAYRTQYVDTATDWYRYNNGYIYRVDPATQLVSAIVASILT